MQANQPLNRRVELKIGPLPEWQGGGSANAAVRLYGDGTTDHLRIKFDVHKNIASTSTPTVFTVYNLSPGIRASLQKAGIQIAAHVGWNNSALVELFKGGVQACVSRREGADIVTDILCLAGFGATARGVMSVSFNAGVPIKDLVLDAAKKLAGVTIDEKLIKLDPAVTGSQGYSFAGRASNFLDKLARTYGFSWWITDGIFHALTDTEALQTGTVVISSASGLLRADPQLSSPMQIVSGVTIKSILNPHILPGREVKLVTKINPALSGMYKVHTLSHSGDTHSSNWETSIESWVHL